MATLAELSPTRKDVVIAEVGAAAALVGLVLVFLGVVVTSYQTLLGQVRKDALIPFVRAASISFAVFVIGLISLVLSVLWLVTDGGKALYVSTLVAFFTALAGLVLVATYSIWRVLLR